MSLVSTCMLGALVLAFVASLCAIPAVMAVAAQEAAQEPFDDARVLWQERQALRTLRARYASGEVGPEEFKEISLELEESLPR